MKQATLVAALALALALTFATAIHAQDKQTVRPEIGKPVEAAQNFLKQKKYKEALDQLRAADGVANKTPYETYVVAATRAAVDVGSGDDADAIKSLEAVLATNILPPKDAVQRIEALVELDYRVKDYPKTVQEAQRYYQAGGADPAPRLLMAQAYYLENDFADATKTLHQIVAADQQAGRASPENVLVMLLNAAAQQKDGAARIAALELLVKSYPKKEYWSQLIASVQREPGFSDRLALDVDRLKLATGTLDQAADYMEAAQLSLQLGLPGDAKSILDQGAKAGVLGKGADADREKRLADLAAKQSADDQAQLASFAKEADAAPDGLKWEKLGEAYLSYGQYPPAIAAFQKAIAKGGLKAPDDARLHLGVAQLRAGQHAPAKATLAAVAGKDGTQALAQLWLITVP